MGWDDYWKDNRWNRDDNFYKYYKNYPSPPTMQAMPTMAPMTFKPPTTSKLQDKSSQTEDSHPYMNMNTLGADSVRLASNILNSLGNQPKEGEFFTQEDIDNLKTAASLTRDVVNTADQMYPPQNNAVSRDVSKSDTQIYPPPPVDNGYYNPYYNPSPPPYPRPRTQDSGSNTGVVLGLAIGIPLAILIIALFIAFCCWRKRKNNSHTNRILPLPIPKVTNNYVKQENSPVIASADPWELNRVNLSINYENKLGSGAFCNVFKGLIIGESPLARMSPDNCTMFVDCDCAIKMLPSFADDIARSDFIQEINFMKSLNYHPHLVSMLGYVSDARNPLLLVEICDQGDLLHLIRQHKDEIQLGPSNFPNGLKIRDLLSFSWQISNGLEYLNSVGCIHRDIAARNVLVDSSNVCKIGDFGLCRLTDSLLYTARGGRLPLKWMAPESLSSYEYTFKSDVWSYGVLLWELFSLGEVPYNLIQTTDLYDYLRDGGRLPQPNCCTEQIYTIMTSCWEFQPIDRPSFTKICELFASLLAISNENYGYLVPNTRIPTVEQVDNV